MKILELQKSPSAFRSALLIDTDSGPRPLAEVIDDWQAKDFESLDGGWQRAIGQKVQGGFSRGWLERPRGHSKSSDVMTSATWALFASRRQLSGIVAAVDRDQAALDRDHVARLVSLNPWLSAVLDITAWKITNKHTGSSMEILASDVASSWGLLIDFAVCDEVTVWPKRDLFDSILSAAAKRANCILLCIGNAGFQDSWQSTIREQIREDEGWYYSRQEGPVASWISSEILAEQERLLPPAAYRRLWLNEWSSGAGDAIDQESLASAFRCDVTPMEKAHPDYDFVAGLDLGVSRDASALCVLGVRRSYQGHGRIRLASTRVWKPTKNQKVDLADVEEAILDTHARFGLRQINYDPWQAVAMAQRLQAGGVGRLVKGADRKATLPMVEVPPTGSNLQRMASCVLEAFSDRRLELYPDPDLRRDLERMRIVEKSYGFRLESPRDVDGHSDLGSAFALAMLAASELASTPRSRIGGITQSSPMSDTFWSQFLRRKQHFDEDQRRPSDDDAEWRAIMRACGRVL